MKFGEKTHRLRAVLTTIVFAAMSGCSNHFADYYVAVDSAPKRESGAVSNSTRVELIRTVDEAVESCRLTTSGYKLIGTSKFEAPAFNTAGDEALSHAKAVNADVVVLKETLINTKTLYVNIERAQTDAERQQCGQIPRPSGASPFRSPIPGRSAGSCNRSGTPMPLQVAIKNYSATFWRRIVDIAERHPQQASESDSSNLIARVAQPLDSRPHSVCNHLP